MQFEPDGRCSGKPGWECGRITSGREGWCPVHGDRETREACWQQHGQHPRPTKEKPFTAPGRRTLEQELLGVVQVSFEGWE